MSSISLENYKKLQEDVSQLRLKLQEINEKKEQWFKKKEDLKKELTDMIHKIKEIKAEKDKKNEELRTLKDQRDKYNDEVQKLIKQIRDLNEEKQKIFKKYNIKVDPSKIQEKINEIEKKVEVETNFEKEKKLMEEIKKLKRTYEESSGVLQIAAKADLIDKQIKDTKKKAEEFHRKIRDTTRDTAYDVFIELSRRITELKKEQEAAFQKFIDYKNEYSGFNQDLNNKLDELGVLKLVFQKDRAAQKIDRDERQRVLLNVKIKSVEEKLRTKKKLTTEDLIALQGSPSEE